jgi:parallel beta-helix repeat protein
MKMGKKKSLLLVCLTVLLGAIVVQASAAQFLVTVTINADGTVEPANAPLQQAGNTYILMADVGGINVQRSNMILDGNGLTLPGMVSSIDSLGNNITANNAGGVYLKNVENVTVQNLIIENCQTGVFLDRSSKCVIANNTISRTHAPAPAFQPTAAIYVWSGNANYIAENQLTNNYIGIFIGYGSQQQTITRNNITNSTYAGISFWNASGNTIFNNNFVNNTVKASSQDSANSWDNGSTGNFWSGYNGTDSNGDGLGDVPYAVNENNQDNYPLITQRGESDSTSTPFPVVLVSVATGTAIAMIASALVFKKYKH